MRRITTFRNEKEGERVTLFSATTEKKNLNCLCIEDGTFVTTAPRRSETPVFNEYVRMRYINLFSTCAVTAPTDFRIVATLRK